MLPQLRTGEAQRTDDDDDDANEDQWESMLDEENQKNEMFEEQECLRAKPRTQTPPLPPTKAETQITLVQDLIQVC